MEAYLDNSATTMMCNEAKEEMLNAINNIWGNPSSLHQKGIEAETLLENARKTVANSICALPKEIVFTSGGTQSNNIAVYGAAYAMRRNGKKVITTSIEHPSVSKAFDRLSDEGFEVIRLSVDKYGNIDLDELKSALDKNTVLVSIMAVNNELGSIEPVKEAGKLIKELSNAVFHIDAVQAFGKIPLDVRKIGCDLMSISSHKVHGPKGAGALYVKSGTKLLPFVSGGGQERDIRSGTEPMPAIAGFYGAVKALDVSKSLKEVTALRENLVEKLSSLNDIVINSEGKALPYIVNISLPSLPSEAVLNLLSDMEIYISAGSACSKGHQSPVLTAAGLDKKIIDSSLRISLSRFTTQAQIDYLVSGLETALKVIRRK